MKTLAELEAVRNKLAPQISLRREHHGTKITVAMGTSGIEAGAGKILAKLSELIISKEIADTIVYPVPQTEHKGREPVVTVIEKNGETTVYGNVDEVDAAHIITQHLVQGIKIENLII